MPTDAGLFLFALERRSSLPVAFALLGASLALVYSLALVTPTYVSKAEVLVAPPVFASPVDAGGGSGVVNVGNERELVHAASVAQLVRTRLQSDSSVADLQRRVGVAVPGDTEILSITFRANSELGAQRGAQAYAEAYLDLKRQRAATAADRHAANVKAAVEPIEAELSVARRRLASAPPASAAQAAAKATVDALIRQAAPYYRDLADATSVETLPSGSIVSPANRPQTPDSPRPVVTAFLGAMAGLCVGVALALVRDRLDLRLRSRGDLEEYLRAPVLATVPRRRTRKGVGPLVTLELPKSAPSEAYRALRARMLWMAARRGLKTIMVASPNGEGGKTAVAANLAVSLAQAGKAVTLLTTDLRDSEIHTCFGLDNEEGLSSVLAGEVPPGDATREPGVEGLHVLSSGPTPAQPAELLQSESMRDLLAAQVREADFVVIEAPPALGAAECLAIAPWMDGILVVASAGETRRDEVALVRQQLDLVGAHVVGGVLSNARAAGPI